MESPSEKRWRLVYRNGELMQGPMIEVLPRQPFVRYHTRMVRKRSLAAAAVIIGILALTLPPMLLIGGYSLWRPEPARFDGTSEETFEASVKRVLNGRSPQEERQLGVAFVLIGLGAKSEAEWFQTLRTTTHGKTFAEVVAVGEERVSKYGGKEAAQDLVDRFGDGWKD
jgi:hypothetical protein